jgi:pilus assembly protein Flp/PilA
MFEIVNRVLAWHNSRNRDRGASAVEYALILFAVAAVIAVIVGALGNVVFHKFDDSCTAIHGGKC